MKRLLFALLIIPVLALGVASTADAQEARQNRRNANTISNEELRQTEVSNLYEAIQQLRPRWMVQRAVQSFGAAGEQGILVYQNQTRLGGLDVLRQLSPESFHSIQYMDGPTATASLPGIGRGHVAGAIILLTRAPR